jgi:hypothetical protein
MDAIAALAGVAWLLATTCRAAFGSRRDRAV